MRRSTIAGIVAGGVLVCLTALAADQAESPAFRYFEQVGLKANLEKQRADQAAMVRSELQGMVTQMSEFSEEEREKLGVLVDDVIKEVLDAYSVDEALHVYAEAFDRNYPGDQFQKAQAMLSTPEGQRMSQTISEALAALSQFQSARVQAAFRQAIPGYLAKVRALSQSMAQQRKEAKSATQDGLKPK
jgi:hypothetical protein